jgi:hypothetical protein
MTTRKKPNQLSAALRELPRRHGKASGDLSHINDKAGD